MVRPSVLKFAEEMEDGFAGMRVEIAGRLVGEDDLGTVHQRPGDGHALLLAAGKLHRAMLAAVLEVRPA